MPAVCVCDCGLDVDTDANELCVDWSVVGMHRQCDTAEAYSNNLAGSTSSLVWVQLRDAVTNWTNQTCRTHRVLVRAQLPYVLLKLGENNAWQVRVMLDAAVGAPPVFDGTRQPELFWSTVWSGGLPVGTDGEQQTPGNAHREVIVPPGATVFTHTYVQVRTPTYTNRPQNLLQIAPLRVSLAAWPAKTTAGSGRTC